VGRIFVGSVAPPSHSAVLDDFFIDEFEASCTLAKEGDDDENSQWRQTMKPKIDPKVDCVFKAILGNEDNTNLLIHFLNAVLHPGPGARIQEVEILNPYNEREFESDKLSVVDVKARDDQGRAYQIEIQLALHPGLPARMLYTWSSIYHGLLRKGQVFTELRPVIAI
jgi:hypothetical protein